MVFKIVIVILTVIIVVIASLGIYSSFIDPIINQAVFIDVPDEDQISWSFNEDSLEIDASIWINNTGYYPLEDINLYVLMEGLNATFFEETMDIERVDSGENREIPISFTVDMESLPGDITIDDLIFDNVIFNITSHLTANYPFSLMDLEFDYESTFEWLGIVNKLEFDHNETRVSSEQEGSVLEIPFEIDTNDVISGVAEVDLALWDEDRNTKYAETTMEVHLGVINYDWIRFELDEEKTEHFIMNSETVHFVATVYLPDSDVSFDYTIEHYWGAPLRDFEIGELSVDENYVSSNLYFFNDSPRTLYMVIDIEVINENTGVVGIYEESFTVYSGEALDEEISIYVFDIPDYATIEIHETNSGYTYETVVEDI